QQGRPKHAESSVLSMKPKAEGKKDYLATGVFVIVLCALIAIGVYFSLNIRPDAWNRPLQMISRLVDEVGEYGKTVLGGFNKKDRPAIRQARQAQRHVRKGYEHYKDNRLKDFFSKGDLKKAVENAEAACKLGYKDGCRDAKRYGAELNENDRD
ncbi:MAG: hypothetical protein P8185_18840, partial [Deltaproteobacteria bacterium]